MDQNDRRSLLYSRFNSLCPFVSSVHLCISELVSGCCVQQSHLLSPGIRQNFCLIRFFSEESFLIPDDWMNWLYGAFFPPLFLLVWSPGTITLLFSMVRAVVAN